MNPTECAPRDWRLYYHRTLMRHSRHGLGEVSIEERTLHFRKLEQGARYRETEPSYLECVWPMPGAINLDGRAYYLGRRARRAAQRSCTLHHYFTAWGSNVLMASVNRWMIQALVDADYPPIEEAIADILGGVRTSCAISRDLILGPALGVVAKGEEVGHLVQQDGEYYYESELERNPLSRRAAFKLQKEGILCL